ncbi:helix-turn-helix domain-containing protein [Micromonospora sp. WMMD882]|nr:helix-turn-helix domain-containing protein [Micromonospora sp. WMMD882]WBB79003.1 helix-turn-helix domain-containing protein [Micromonospora sp. WMMD882]
MATPKDLPRDVGGFIRDLRRNAKISLRQLAEQAGVSNPYLSQIERGLRKPSAEVLQQLASALRVSTPAMYLRAGLLDDRDGPGVLAAIAADPDLTMAQKQSLSQIYETFRRENIRLAEATATTDQSAPGQAAADQSLSGQAAADQPLSDRAAAARSAGGGIGGDGTAGGGLTGAAATVNPVATGPTTAAGTPTEAVLESVAVTEAGPAPAPGATTRRTPGATTRNTPRKSPKNATAPAVEEENPS